MRKEEILKKAIEHYGKKNQIVKAIEELSELQKELCTYLLNHNNQNALAEEIADVSIMLEQCKIIFSCHSKTKVWHDLKIAKLNRKLKGR